jgi:Zn ribbon nucleic-acid-binding protein
MGMNQDIAVGSGGNRDLIGRPVKDSVDDREIVRCGEESRRKQEQKNQRKRSHGGQA